MAKALVHDIELDYEISGAGDPLVLIHGAQSDRSVFNVLLPALTPRFRVLSFDQRGIGQSSKPDTPYSMAMLADDTAALMDAVDFARAHVFGVSMGGMIGQELALRHPGCVRSLILGCTTPGGPGALGLEEDASTTAYSTEDLSADERARALASTIFTAGYLDAHPEVIASLTRAREEKPLEPAAFARRMEAVRTHDTRDRLAKIDCPTLVITGKDDAIISWEQSQVLAERVPGARLAILEPAGHGFWIEQPETTIEAVLAFLAEVGGEPKAF